MHEARKSRPADVWALGTTLWELFSYGQQPFAGRSLAEMREHYKTHVYLEKPESCMLEEFWEVYETMKKCWHREQSGRIEPQALMRDLHLVSSFVSAMDSQEATGVIIAPYESFLRSSSMCSTLVEVKVLIMSRLIHIRAQM